MKKNVIFLAIILFFGFSQPQKQYCVVHMEHGGYFAKTFETKTHIDLGKLEGYEALKEVEKLNSETEIINFMVSRGWEFIESEFVLFGQMFDKELFFRK